MSDISISQGSKLSFGATDADFIGVGTSMFLTINLLMFTISNLMDHQPPALLDSMMTITGAILMITAGALCLSFYVPRYKEIDTQIGGLLFKTAKVSVRVCWCGG